MDELEKLNNQFIKNREVLISRLPNLRSQLLSIQVPTSALVIEEGKVVNFLTPNGPFYPDRADLVIDRWWKDYQAAPKIIKPHSVDVFNISKMTAPIYDACNKYVEELDKTITADCYAYKGGYCFIIGLSLLSNLNEIIKQISAPHIVVYEIDIACIIISCYAIDWGQIFDIIDSRNGTISINIVDYIPKISGIFPFKDDMYNVFIDGSCILSHINLDPYNQIDKYLTGLIYSSYYSTGFFEDELNHLENTCSNLVGRRGRLGDPRRSKSTRMPAVVVGAGPSLDHDLAYLKAVRKNIVIFSAGSALNILLDNDVFPDFHCEVEADLSCAELLDRYTKRYRNDERFEKIVLLSAIKANPLFSKLFSNVVFFVSSIWATSSMIIPGSGKTPLHAGGLAANAAYAFVRAMGFNNVYLFGVDMATRNPDLHHAKDSVWYKDDEAKTQALRAMEFEIPANFGGLIYTKVGWNISRSIFNEYQRTSPINLVNCSDGAYIEGTTACRAINTGLDKYPQISKEFLMDLVDNLYDSAQMDEAEVASSLGLHLERGLLRVQALRAQIDEFRKTGRPLLTLAKEIHEGIDPSNNKSNLILALIFGSIKSSIRVIRFYSEHIADPDERYAFDQMALGLLDEMIEKATEIAVERLQKFVTGSQIG